MTECDISTSSPSRRTLVQGLAVLLPASAVAASTTAEAEPVADAGHRLADAYSRYVDAVKARYDAGAAELRALVAYHQAGEPDAGSVRAAEAYHTELRQAAVAAELAVRETLADVIVLSTAGAISQKNADLLARRACPCDAWAAWPEAAI